MGAVKRIGQLLGWLLSALLLILLLCNLYMIGARYFTGALQPDVFGWSWAVVISGSMEPQIRVNDLVVVRQQRDYHPGDVISFESGRSIVTHRVIEKGEACFITQGDANNTPDLSPVPRENVVGKVIFVIPKIGAWIQGLQSPLGMTCLVLAGIALIEIPYLVENARQGKRR